MNDRLIGGRWHYDDENNPYGPNIYRRDEGLISRYLPHPAEHHRAVLRRQMHHLDEIPRHMNAAHHQLAQAVQAELLNMNNVDQIAMGFATGNVDAEEYQAAIDAHEALRQRVSDIHGLITEMERQQIDLPEMIRIRERNFERIPYIDETGRALPFTYGSIMRAVRRNGPWPGIARLQDFNAGLNDQMDQMNDETI